MEPKKCNNETHAALAEKANSENEKLIVVVSAFGKTTNHLIHTAKLAQQKNDAYKINKIPGIDNSTAYTFIMITKA